MRPAPSAWMARSLLLLWAFITTLPVSGVAAELAFGDLPAEAQQTLRLIKQGGPFSYRQDGAVFSNFERRLPLHERGYYHEYTVATPRHRQRGSRRIVAGAHGEYYYSDDHYLTFRRIRE
jgi:ribonuclease T1